MSEPIDLEIDDVTVLGKKAAEEIYEPSKQYDTSIDL